MGSRSQDNYHVQASVHKSSSCICCSCSEEDKELVATQSNSAIRCRCWESNTPPQPPEAWRETFDQLVRQWANQTQNRGSEDHIRPYFPTPGEVRIMFGKSDINDIPEYATGYNMRDPQEWRPDAYQAPTINQQVEEWARWERATLHVSVKSFDPVTGSHFSLGSTWNPGTVPVVNSNSRNTPTQFKSEADELDTKRAHVESLLRQSSLSTNEKQEVINAFLKNTVVISGNRVEVSIAMLRRSTANNDEKKRTLFSALKENADKLDRKRGVAKAVIDAFIPDINAQSAMFVNIFRKTRNGDSESESDYYNQVMNDVTMLTEGRDMTNDETRADVESLVRTSQLNAREKGKVIDTLLNNNLDPNLRKTYAESMIRRCAMSNDERRANIISILQDADITPSSKAEVIAMILEEDSKTGNVFDNSYNTGNRDIDNIINESVSGTSLRSMWDEQSKISVKPSRSIMGINQLSGMESLNESSTTQGQKSGELYSAANMNQPSKYSNLQGQSASLMYGLERDSRRDISKTTANVESVRSMRDQVSKASFKPSRSQMDRSQMSAMDNTSIPPHLLESYTSHGQNYGGQDSSKYNLQGQSPYQMYGSHRSLGEDVSRTTCNTESVRNARDQASKATFKPSRSQMDRSQTSAMDNMSNIYESQRDLRGDISKTSRNFESVRSIKDPSKATFKPSRSQMDRSQTSAMDNVSNIYESQRDLRGDISKTSRNVESVRSIKDPSKATFKPSRSQMDRSQTSAMDNMSNIYESQRDLREDISKTSRNVESVRSIKDPSKATFKPSRSQMDRSQTSAMDNMSNIYESQRDLREDISKTSRNVESVRSIKDPSKASFKPSHSHMDRSQPSAMDNMSNIYESQRDLRGDISKTSRNVESVRSMKDPSKASFKPSHSHMDRSQTSAMDNGSIIYGSQRDIKGDIDNVESVRSVKDPSKSSLKPSRSQMERSQMSAMESNLSVQGQSASKLSKKNVRDDISMATLTEIMESVISIKDQTSKASVKPRYSQMEKSQRSVMDHSQHHLEPSTSQGHKSRELYSTANLNQSSKHSNIKSQGQSPSEMYGSKRDIRGDVSKTKYNGNVESLRTIKENESKCSVKPSRSLIDNSPSIISHHLPLDDMRSSISLDSDEKLVDLEDQEHSLPKKSILCTKCNYLKTCGCVKLCNN